MKRLQGYWLLTLAYSFNAVFLVIGSMAFAQTPITSSGLNTQVSGPIAVGSQTQFNITGGTRPGGGTNLFHSFGNFNVPNNNVANFLNNTGLPTTNILGRVTGGNVSNIFGTIQTSGFGNANLFLMNPAGFLFGPNATVNVGGMVTFTSADYLRLADGAKFTAKPSATADALLSAAPVAAFGFLGSNPAAITVQGSQLTVAEGTGISLVGGNITVQGGTLTAPSGQVNLISVGKPSTPQGAEVTLNGAGLPTGFKGLGTISLTQGSTVDTSAIAGSGHAAGGVSIRGGQFIMDDSSIRAVPAGNAGTGQINGNIEVSAKEVALSNSTIVTSTPTGPNHFTGSPGNITFNVNTFFATDSGIGASVFDSSAPSGAVTIQGLQGSGSSAHSVSLSNANIVTANAGLPTPGHRTDGGPIYIQADKISLNHTSLNTSSRESAGGTITLVSNGGIDIRGGTLDTRAFFGGTPGAVDLRAGFGISLTGTTVDARATNGSSISGMIPGTITMAAPLISIGGSTLDVSSGSTGGLGPGGMISLTGTKAVSLTNGTILSADNASRSPDPSVNGGTILINGGHLFTSQDSTISAKSLVGNGGTIHMEGSKIQLSDTTVMTSASGGPQTVGGTISVDAKNTTLTNSQILSTATQGTGGTITINSKALHQNSSTVIDASSQTGTDGTVTINGVIQP